MICEQDIKTLIIHGVGVEGRAALRYWQPRLNAKIIVIDRPEALAKEAMWAALEDLPEGRLSFIGETDFLSQPLPNAEHTLYLRSPGIAPSNNVWAKIREATIAHTTPTGYWLATNTPKHLVTITGTKGKSSTTSLTCLLLQWAGREALALGNIGTPPFEAIINDQTICIVELSSYMMHDLPLIKTLHCVTSLYHEHTDWHGSFEAYASDKLRPFSWVPAADGLMTEDITGHLPPEATPPAFFENVVPLDHTILQLSEDIFVDAARLNDAFNAPSLLKALRAAASICLTKKYLTAAQMKATLEKHLPAWAGLPSRQEIIPTTDNRLWVNDALATVPEATSSALIRFADRPVQLLLGGQNRGQSFDGLMEQCAKRQDIQLYGFGQTANAMAAAAEQAGLSSRFSCYETFEEMIEAAATTAPDGAVILFSPAAPSGPPHAHYQQRAAIFANAAKARQS